ncbi:hypothetical protein HU200_050507 [Digitaria exilis]|uniref:Oxidative stress 3 n=1 Tax=Digitaria exilis TaxID=1010633 RepID=A0A835E5S0_9POAL|nr:hypothetical protein HU200_050507 [Digitaria exilis]
MAEPCNMVPLCDDESFNERSGDHSESASSSGVSSRSLCSSASNLSDDATSSPPLHPSETSSASSSMLQLDAEDPLYELSSLLAQLPIRNGLSKYYQGKSQSFTSISDATCVQDLAKKISYSKRMKTCKSYSAGLDMNRRSNNLPRASNKVIAKRPSNGSVGRVMSRAAHQERCTNVYWSVTK